MQVSDPNNVKIYNLSAGKSLPDWLSDRKRRALQNKDIDIRRRIELIQDFSMPGLSTSVKLSRNNQYILATGIYKPRVRCYEVNNLSMKFERCFDSDIVTFSVLSEDYSKLVFLQSDRYVEFHNAGGRYFRLRMPKFGRDMQYHISTCDLYLVGSGKDIYRLNLELGQFLNSFESEGSEINKVAINPVHGLVAVGTREGKVEGWDPRMKSRMGILDCALSAVTADSTSDLLGFPSITALEFQGAVGLSVGTAVGQILLYDLRSNKPLRVKDHMYGLPIRDIAHYQGNVLSMDSSIVKIWNQNTGSLFTSIEAGDTTQFNNLCVVPDSGLMFIANESPKILTYYIPSLGPAPKWCSFLDNLTEELEETLMETVYDDYKFVMKSELEDLGLSHLIGTNMLRAYMHGYFIDIRLYRKAKSVAEPFAFEDYRRRKVREKIEGEWKNRVQTQKLPNVNKDLALKLINDTSDERKKKKISGDILSDNRFKALFENPDFQVDINAEEYRLLNPVLSRLDKSKAKELKKKYLDEQFKPIIEGKEEILGSSEGESIEESSSEDDQELSKEIRKTHRQVNRDRKQKEWEDYMDITKREKEEKQLRQPKFFELKAGEEFSGVVSTKKHWVSKASLEERLKQEYQNNVRMLSTGNREMTFTVKKKGMHKMELMKKHLEERKKLMRPPPKTLARSKFFSGMKRRR